MNIEIREKDLFVDSMVVDGTTDTTFFSQEITRKLDLDEKSRLFILDKKGIRFWTQNNLISEIQICLNENGKSSYYPEADFHESILINGVIVNRETKVDKNFIEKLKLSVDDDNLKYKILTYFFRRHQMLCSFTLNSEKQIRNISISFV